MAQNHSGTNGSPRLALSTMDSLDEVDAVLTALRELSRQVSSPVVKACLDGARADIAYLTAVEDGGEADGINHEDDEDSVSSAA